MRALVYGLGRSGSAAARLLRRQGHEVVAFDQTLRASDREALSPLGVHFSQQPLSEDVNICIAAPGVPFDHPDLVGLRSKGLETIGEVEWVYRSLRADILGITGTAGKGTVTKWLEHVLVSAGLNAVAGGNLDPALSAVAEDDKVLVAELSSFQLERCPTLKPKLAIILNLDRDHLDRHGSVAAYHEAKRQLIKNQTNEDSFIYCAENDKLRRWAAQSPARTFSYGLSPKYDAYLSRGELYVGGASWLRAEDLSLSGHHQHMNALAVILAARDLGLTREQIVPPLTTFKGLPGRFAEVGRVGQVRFIEDSIATRTLAVKAALEASAPPIAWILGGADKGAELTELSQLTQEKVVLALGVGEAGPTFTKALSAYTDTLVIDEADGEGALELACKQALSALPEGGTVLLAPLAASFDQFKDYKARATAFRKVVAQLSREST